LPLCWALPFFSRTFGGSSDLFSQEKNHPLSKTTIAMPELVHHPSSYRDPAGFIFQVEGVYYRQVNQCNAADYELLMGSGLYRALVGKELLISHRELTDGPVFQTDTMVPYKTLLPLQLSSISYPYEWSFTQLKDAALLTLDVMNISVRHDMALKDATPFNIQFLGGKPVFIDTLSFEKYEPALPWVAYRQFCECFLFPLLLEHYCGVEQKKIQTAWPDGISARLTSRLLPWKSRLNAGTLLHVHLQNSIKTGGKERKTEFSRQKLLHILQHLEGIIKKLKTNADSLSVWNQYYNKTILSQEYLMEKERLFRQILDGINFRTALDIGTNDGHFTRILSERKDVSITAIDADSICIDRLYTIVRENDLRNILPLCIDLLQPSPAIGLRNKERASFHDRAHPDLVVALAVAHHLILSSNIPIPDLADYFARLSASLLIVEFVPIDDDKVRELIRNKRIHHTPYDAAYFEQCFREHFVIERQDKIAGTERILYLMKKKS
jgi:hypothetical protein